MMIEIRKFRNLIFMDYNQATLHAATGATLMLPGWEGYFKWDWEKKELYFQNGDYYLNDSQIKEMKLDQRNDWYYIT